MKYNLIIFFLLLNTASFAQVEWRCVYNDTLFMTMTDSSIQKFGADLQEKNIPQEVVDTIMKKMVAGPASTERTRYVSAYTDSTLISIESEYSLLKRGELYILDRRGDPDSMVTRPRKIFKTTGRELIYFKNLCKEYVSTDSTCTIWVAEQLPTCINPGIRVGDI